jgi:hypothetical protein
MRSESTSALGQPRDVNDMRGARSMLARDFQLNCSELGFK